MNWFKLALHPKVTPKTWLNSKVLSYQAAITWEPFSSSLRISKLMEYL